MEKALTLKQGHALQFWGRRILEGNFQMEKRSWLSISDFVSECHLHYFQPLAPYMLLKMMALV